MFDRGINTLVLGSYYIFPPANKYMFKVKYQNTKLMYRIMFKVIGKVTRTALVNHR